jgi:diguanylate cyclase (GGDEF)-like protein
MLLRANVQLGKITLSLEQANRELKKVIAEKIELTEKLKSANEKLAHQAVTDGLTGIFNHRFFYEVLNKRFSEARRHNYPLSCIMADIDYFKIFNDTFGHRAGDEVLLKVATIIKNTVRNEDIVARYGGEEFIILLPETGKERAKLVAERIRENIENEKFLDKLSKGEVTISFGVATYTKEKNWTSPNSLVKESDKALYLAKRNGRNRVEIV